LALVANNAFTAVFHGGAHGALTREAVDATQVMVDIAGEAARRVDNRMCAGQTARRTGDAVAGLQQESVVEADCAGRSAAAREAVRGNACADAAKATVNKVVG
jgi:hypothetical protein